MNKDNQPICETDEFGNKRWYLNGQYHREDGPAVEYSNGDKEWFLNDQYHREDGPAIELTDGTKCWYIHDQRHRVDGPATEYANGKKYWYYQGEYIKCSSQEEFEKIINLK